MTANESESGRAPQPTGCQNDRAPEQATPPADQTDQSGPRLVDPTVAFRSLARAIEMVPKLAPLALFSGWLAVAAYARALGLQPGDLGLGITEILVLAAINLVVGSLLIVGVWLLQSGGWGRAASGFALVAASGVFFYSTLSLTGVVIGVLFGLASASMAWIAKRTSRAEEPRPVPNELTTREFAHGLGLLALVPIVLIALQMFAAHASGSALRDGKSSDLPAALTMVLPADKGTLDGECVLRLAPRVYVHLQPKAQVFVLNEAPSDFEVGCLAS